MEASENKAYAGKGCVQEEAEGPYEETKVADIIAYKRFDQCLQISHEYKDKHYISVEQKDQEVLVIAIPDAVVKPVAMVVHLLYTLSALPAMMRPFWLDQITELAVPIPVAFHKLFKVVFLLGTLYNVDNLLINKVVKQTRFLFVFLFTLLVLLIVLVKFLITPFL